MRLLCPLMEKKDKILSAHNQIDTGNLLSNVLTFRLWLFPQGSRRPNNHKYHASPHFPGNIPQPHGEPSGDPQGFDINTGVAKKRCTVTLLPVPDRVIKVVNDWG